MKSCKNFTILLILCAVSTNVVLIPLEEDESTMGSGAQKVLTPASTVEPPVNPTATWKQLLNSTSESLQSSGPWNASRNGSHKVSSTVSTPMSPMNSNPVSTTREEKQPLNSTGESPHLSGPWSASATSTRRQEELSPASTSVYNPPTSPVNLYYSLSSTIPNLNQPMNSTSERPYSFGPWNATSNGRQEVPSPAPTSVYNSPMSPVATYHNVYMTFLDFLSWNQPLNTTSEPPQPSGPTNATNTRRQEVWSTVSTPTSPMNSIPVLTTREGKQVLNSTTERPQSFGPWNAISNGRQEVPSPGSTSVYNSPMSSVAKYLYLTIGFLGSEQLLNTTSERPQPSGPRNATNTRRHKVSSTVSTPRSPINFIGVSTSPEGNKPSKSTSERPHSSGALSIKFNQTEIIIAMILLLCISCKLSY